MSEPSYAHYRMTEGAEIEKAPAATEGDCVAYLIEDGGQDKLCVIEGGAFHNFRISPLGLARLAEESTRNLRKHMMGQP